MMATAKTRATLKRLRALTKRRTSHQQASNIYGSAIVREWFYLAWAGWDFDLTPESVGGMPDWKVVNLELEREIDLANQGKPIFEQLPYPKPPAWWPWWMDDRDDLQEVLGIGWRSGRAFEHGREWNEEWRKWALTNGIAPGQLFCVDISEPEVERSGYETVEYDIHWAGEVVDVIPLSSSATLRRWEHDQRRTTKARAEHVALASANAALMDRDVASMFIQQSLYCVGGADLPSGRACTLLSSRQLNPCGMSSIGTQGRCDEGSVDVAMDRLIALACKRNPYLSPAILRKMRVIR